MLFHFRVSFHRETLEGFEEEKRGDRINNVSHAK